MSLLLATMLAPFAMKSTAQSMSHEDTSYTVRSATVKMLKKFPDARLVGPELPKGVVAYTDIVFASYGSRHLRLDLFMPDSSGGGPYPGVILIHGGGWSSGSRSMLVPMAERLAARGYVTATVDYRLSGEALYPAAVYDLKAAVRWMRANAEQYRVDPSKIAAYGCSAGGELASFIGTTNGVSKFEGEGGYGEFSSEVQAIVNVDGLLDFTNANSTKYDKNPAKPSAAHRWLGDSYKDDPALWKAASPISYVSKHVPPMLLINSSMAHYHAGRDKMVHRLNTLGVYSEVDSLPGTIHTFWLFHPWFEKTLDYTSTFLDKTLKLGLVKQDP